MLIRPPAMRLPARDVSWPGQWPVVAALSRTPIEQLTWPEGVSAMVVHRRMQVSDVGGVSVVRFVDRKILDEANIQELGQELFQLVEDDNRKKLLLNFATVEFLSSAALGKLITLDKKVKARGGRLKLSNIR